MSKEKFREEQRTWSPTPQIPKLAPPVDRTRRTGGALGDTPGVEADIDWAKLAGGVLSSIPNFF